VRHDASKDHWHRLEVFEDDGVGGFPDWDIEHTPACPWRVSDDGPFGYILYTCLTAWELENNGLVIEVQANHAYEIRGVGGWIPANPINGGPEWDFEWEVRDLGPLGAKA